MNSSVRLPRVIAESYERQEWKREADTAGENSLLEDVDNRPQSNRPELRFRVLRYALHCTFPVLLGYSAIGIAFGLLLKNAGYPWYLAPIMSVSVYSGVQYLAIGLFIADASLLQGVFLALVVNARHMVYGLSLLQKYQTGVLRKLYLIFALSDETYALVTSVAPPKESRPETFYTAVSALNQSYWVLGSTLGSVLGNVIPFDFTGLNFALTALFVVLLVEQLKTSKSKIPFAAAGICCVVAYFAVGPKEMLVTSVFAMVLVMLGVHRRIGSHVPD